MEIQTQTKAENLEILKQYNLVFMATRAGQGHLTQASELCQGLLPDSPHINADLTAILKQYALIEHEKHAVLMLDYFNDALLTRTFLNRVPPAGLHALDRVIDPGFTAVGYLHKLFGISKETPLTYRYEAELAAPMAHFIKDSRAAAFICTLTGSGRIVNQAKAEKLLPADFPVFNLVFDPLGPHLTHSIYDPATEYGIDPHTYNFVADLQTRAIFLSRGYSPEHVFVMDGDYIPDTAEEEIIYSKLADLDRLSLSGPTAEKPLIVSVVHDNFETRFERSVGERLISDYADEIAGRKIIMCATMTSRDVYRLGLFKSMFICANQAELQNFFADSEFRNKYKGVIVLKPPVTNDICVHENYSAMQKLLALNSHISVSRPSEHPRTASRYATPSFMTVPFATQEAYMGKLYKDAGFAGHWTQLERTGISSTRARLNGLPLLDLSDLSSFTIIKKMALAAQNSRYGSGTKGVLAQIAEVLRHYPHSSRS